MSTIPRSATRRDFAVDTHGAPSMEIYGSEDLPVLVRLPDLSGQADPVRPLPDPPLPASVVEGSVATADAAAVAPVADAISVDSAVQEPATGYPDDAPATIPLTDYAADPVASTSEQDKVRDDAPQPRREQRLRQQRQERRDRATRRNERRAAMPRWLRGISQLVFAAVLAGVLLAVVVTLKNWNATGESPRQSNVGVPFVEAPPFELSVPASQEVAHVDGPQGPELGPPTLSERGPTLNGSGMPALDTPATRPDSHETNAPVSYGEITPPVQSVPAAFAGRPPAVNAPQYGTPQYPKTDYPSTGARPVVAAPSASVIDNVRRWGGEMPARPVRSAELPASSNHDHQRHQHR